MEPAVVKIHHSGVTNSDHHLPPLSITHRFSTTRHADHRMYKSSHARTVPSGMANGILLCLAHCHHRKAMVLNRNLSDHLLTLNNAPHLPAENIDILCTFHIRFRLAFLFSTATRMQYIRPSAAKARLDSLAVEQPLPDYLCHVVTIRAIRIDRSSEHAALATCHIACWANY